MRRSIRSLMLSGVAVAFYGQPFICRQNQPGDDFAALPRAAGYVNAAAVSATHVINNNTASSTPFVTPDGIGVLPRNEQQALALFCHGLETATAPPSGVRLMPNYWTQCFDNLRTGWNPEETVLTPGAISTRGVGPTILGQLFSYPVQGQVYAQPLYIQNVALAAEFN
jgi:hypothetical protein